MPDADRPAPTKRPSNTAFKQQRLKAWQPILTPKTVLPIFAAIGVLFVVLGAVFLAASNAVQEVMFDYSYCSTEATGSFSTTGPHFPAGAAKAWRYDSTLKICSVQFDTTADFQPPVFLYYRLTNFYQNHRRYVKSYDPNQLMGQVMYGSDLNTNCDPLRIPPAGMVVNGSTVPTAGAQNAQYYPCGLIANSLFSDQIGDPFPASSSGAFVFSPNGISWPSDQQKFQQTGWVNQPNAASAVNTFLIPPPLWNSTFPNVYGNGYNLSNLINVGTNERFQVWMRTAGLPTFRKLWGINSTAAFTQGTWQIDIGDHFNVLAYGGSKSIVISTVSIIGGKNSFLGIAYLTVGLICLALFLGFLIRNMVKPRKLGDHTYLSWNRAAYQAVGSDAGPDAATGFGGGYQPAEGSVVATTASKVPGASNVGIRNVPIHE